MAANEKTFGGAISEARKAKGWALKDLASRVLRAAAPMSKTPVTQARTPPGSAACCFKMLTLIVLPALYVAWFRVKEPRQEQAAT
jgi:hypothetical protein